MTFEIVNTDEYKQVYLLGSGTTRLLLLSVALDVLRDSPAARDAWQTLLGAALLITETHG